MICKVVRWKRSVKDVNFLDSVDGWVVYGGLGVVGVVGTGYRNSRAVASCREYIGNKMYLMRSSCIETYVGMRETLWQGISRVPG